MAQTAVEWLENKVWELDNENFTVPNRLLEMINQAKEMENEQKGYSEEDMKQYAFQCVANFLSNNDNKVEIELVEIIIDRNKNVFEQFKNK